MSKKLIAPALLVFAVSGPASAATDNAGELAFNNHCRQCHSVKKGDNRLGPSLHGIVGAKGGQVPGFNNYSGALADVTWDESTLDKFIADPAAVATNTNMQFPGVDDASARTKIVEYLKSSDRAQ